MAIKIEKEMYAEARGQGLSFTEFLGKVRPSDEESLDAFEFALLEQDINLKSGRVDQFYRTKEDSVLFPEFINRSLRVGIEGLGKRDLVLSDLISTETTIDSGTYESVSAVFDSKKNLDFRRVTEKAPFPTVTIDSAKKAVKLAKIGVQMEATYEVLRRMKLPLLSTHLNLIGKRLAKKMVAYAVYVLVNGDGNANAASETAAALSYDNLLDFDLDMDDWEASVWFAKKATIKDTLKLAEFKDSRLFDTARTGAYATPFGNELKKFNWAETTLGDSKIIQLDRSAALELIREGGSDLVESDKVIDRQFEKTTISQVMGFAKIYPKACKVFKAA